MLSGNRSKVEIFSDQVSELINPNNIIHQLEEFSHHHTKRSSLHPVTHVDNFDTIMYSMKCLRTEVDNLNEQIKELKLCIVEKPGAQNVSKKNSCRIKNPKLEN
jgi:hypothetical protein